MRKSTIAAARLAAILTAATLTAAIVMTTPACRSRAPRAESGAGAPIDLSWSLDRRVVGRATLTVTLRDASGTPVSGATVRVEGHMTHPGMTPIQATAAASDREPGAYHADIAFTMAGDWALLITATLPDGRRVDRRIDVAHVQPAP